MNEAKNVDNVCAHSVNQAITAHEDFSHVGIVELRNFSSSI